MTTLRDPASDMVVVILGGGRGSRLDPLTRERSKPAVPIAGKYRLIDIPISNSIHSGMERMFVLTQYNSVSLHRHIVRTYKFDLFSRGFVQILAAQQTPTDSTWFQGTADAVRQNLRIILETRGETVLVLSGDHMYRMDYRAMLRDHLDHSADITIAVKPCPAEAIGDFGAVRVDGRGAVVEFREKPKDAAARSGMEVPPALLAARGLPTGNPYLLSMGIYMFRKDVLADCLDNQLHDFGYNVIPAAVDRHRTQAHFFGGYWRDIGTIRAFYDAHMDMLAEQPAFDFHDPDWPFYTHPRYLPPARLEACTFHRTLLAEGCTPPRRPSRTPSSACAPASATRRCAARCSWASTLTRRPPRPAPRRSASAKARSSRTPSSTRTPASAARSGSRAPPAAPTRRGPAGSSATAWSSSPRTPWSPTARWSDVRGRVASHGWYAVPRHPALPGMPS